MYICIDQIFICISHHEVPNIIVIGVIWLLSTCWDCHPRFAIKNMLILYHCYWLIYLNQKGWQPRSSDTYVARTELQCLCRYWVLSLSVWRQLVPPMLHLRTFPVLATRVLKYTIYRILDLIALQGPKFRPKYNYTWRLAWCYMLDPPIQPCIMHYGCFHTQRDSTSLMYMCFILDDALTN